MEPSLKQYSVSFEIYKFDNNKITLNSSVLDVCFTQYDRLTVEMKHTLW